MLLPMRRVDSILLFMELSDLTRFLRILNEYETFAVYTQMSCTYVAVLHLFAQIYMSSEVNVLVCKNVNIYFRNMPMSFNIKLSMISVCTFTSKKKK